MIPSPPVPLTLPHVGSRDPIGVSSADVMSGEEPAGILPPRSPSEMMERNITSPSLPTNPSIDPAFAALVGEPPPPPPTPPPKKRRSSQGKKSSTGRGRKGLKEVGSPVQLRVSQKKSPSSRSKSSKSKSLGSPSEEENQDLVERLTVSAKDGTNAGLGESPNSKQPALASQSFQQLPTEQLPIVNSFENDKRLLASEHSLGSTITEQHANHMDQSLLVLAEPPSVSTTETESKLITESSKVSLPTTTSSGGSTGKKKKKIFRPRTPERLRQAHRALTPDRQRLTTPTLNDTRSVGTSKTEAPSTTSSVSFQKKKVSRSKLRHKTPERIRRALTPDRKRSKTPDKRRSKTPDKKRTKTPDKRSNKNPDKKRSKTPEEKQIVNADGRNKSASSSARKIKDDADNTLSNQIIDNDAVDTQQASLSAAKSPRKTGFLRNLFRSNKKKTKSDNLDSDTTTEATEAYTSARPSGGETTENIQDEDLVQEGTQQVISSSCAPHLQREDDDHDTPEFVGHDDVSTLTAPTYFTKPQDPSDVIGTMSDPVGHYFDGNVNKKKDVSDSTLQVLTVEHLEPSGGSFFAIKDISTESMDVRDPTPRGDGSQYNMDNEPLVTAQDPSPGGTVNEEASLETIQTDPFGISPLHKSSPLCSRKSKMSLSDPPLASPGATMVKNHPSAVPSPRRTHASPISRRMDRIPSPSMAKSKESSPNTSDAEKMKVQELMKLAASTATNPVDSDLVLLEASGTSPLDDARSVAGSIATIGSAFSRRSRRSHAKNLTMSSAAKTNAKALAYLHILNGEPSPRRSWNHGQTSDEEATPRKSSRSNKDSLFSPIITLNEQQKELKKKMDDQQKERLFSAYSNTYKDRKMQAKSRLVSVVVKKSASPLPDQRTRKNFPRRSPIKRSADIQETKYQRPVSAIAVGIELRREKRNLNIASGRSMKVVPSPKPNTPKVKSYFVSEYAREPRDPIQRAGRRLLSKAAVPIQATIRRYLAQKEAVDRLWATIEIQSYIRRWRAEAQLAAYRLCATRIQKVARRHLVLQAMKRQEAAATMIQKIVRGYLASLLAFEAVYRIILVQARARGYIARENVRLMKNNASTEIQTWWRGRTQRLKYQYFIVDLIISQSAVRRWLSHREYKSRFNERQHNAATKIQATWRRFQANTDFIFAMMDIIHAQRAAKRWLAKRQLESLLSDRAAVKIQSTFRRTKNKLLMLNDLVRVILVQSVVRRYLVRKQVKTWNCSSEKIQTAWRSFWGFSQYVITLYHISRLQASVRGMIVRRQQDLRLGCCIMIQSSARTFLSKRRVERIIASNIIIAGAAAALRERKACERIQFWWRVVMECRREKHAALVIERFFMMVKREVEKEVTRTSTKRKKSKKSKRKKREEEEKWLERVWLNTVHEEDANLVISPSESTSSSLRIRSPRNAPRGLSHKASSPTHNLVMRHERQTKSSLGELSLTYSADDTHDLSPTSPSLPVSPRRETNLTPGELEDDLSLEEAFLDVAVEQGKKRRDTAEKYMRKFGLRSSPNPRFNPHHFFADDLESISSSTIYGAKSVVTSPKKAPDSTRTSSSAHARLLLHKIGHRPDLKPGSMSPSARGASPRHGKISFMEYPEYNKKSRTSLLDQRDDDEEEFDGEEYGLI